MPRQSRETSATCVYHVILRGVNKQQIFEDDDDYMRFLSVLRRQTQPFDDDKGQFIPPRCYVYAYCLMGNHVHLLIKEGSEAIGDTMKRIASSYVYYYNHKYDRVGHLFQERFKSQPVNDFTYFITLLRYIHQNPLKASLVENIQNYAWSSWMEYTGAVQHGFCSTGVVLDRMSLADLRTLVDTPLSEEDASRFIDIDVYPTKSTYTDAEIWQLLSTLCGASNSTQFQALPRPEQKQYLIAAHEEGIGTRTLSRLTGVPYSVVQRATTGSFRCDGMVSEPLPEDEEYETYTDASEYERYPEY